MLDVIVIEPRNQANVGFIARVMANFSCSRLVLVNPKCKVGVTAKKTAMGGKSILSKAKIVSKFPSNYDYLLGTTAKLGGDFHIGRNAISIKQAALKVSKLSTRRIGLVLGREADGLTNDELGLCDMVVTIPASKKYPTMNISHALAVCLFEIFLASTSYTSHSHIAFASRQEKDILYSYILQSLKGLSKEKQMAQKLVWKHVLGKSSLTKKEAFVLMGYFRNLRR